jgi:hypothetical protein
VTLERGTCQRDCVTQRIFISYRREDSADVTGRIFDRLEQRLGREALFMDIDSIPIGVDFRRRLEEALDHSAVLLAVIGEHWIEARYADGPKAGRRRLDDPDDYVVQELRGAIDKRIPIIPVLVGRASMPGTDELPEDLRELVYRNAAELRSGPDFAAQMARLVGALEPLLGTGAGPRSGLDAGSRGPGNGTAVRLDASFGEVITTPAVLVGTRLGPFSIERHLATGGSALVYLGTNPRTGQRACIKISLPVLSDMETIRRAIARGVRGVVSLNNPNIVRVYEFEGLELLDGRSFYIAMEYVDGRPLDEWAGSLTSDGDGRRSFLRAAYLMARALQAAHTCRYVDEAGFETVGVMHGDVKPGNVLMRADGTPMVNDFMLVDMQRALDPLVRERLKRDRDNLTMAFGTPGFMAPEQEREGTVTIRSDVFGLGCTLAITDQCLRDLPGGWRDLIARMTAAHPEERPAGMDAVADEIATIAWAAGLQSSEMGSPRLAAKRRRGGLIASLARMFCG